MNTPSFIESHVSHITAIQLLQQLGFACLSPKEVAFERRGKLGRVLPEHTLATQLRQCGSAMGKLSLTGVNKGTIVPSSSPNVCRTSLPCHVGPPQVPACGLFCA